MSIDMFAPANADEQTGFNNAFMMVSIYWTHLLDANGGDKAKAYDQMDTFMIAVDSKLSGMSTDDSVGMMRTAREINDA